MVRLDWSEQSPHIRSLFRPWHPGDGYEEDVIAAGEARCLAAGQHLAATLRSFYGTWGRRRDLTEMNEYLLSPEEWVVHSGALIFCVENQATAYWALRLGSLAGMDPEVVVAYAGPEQSFREVGVDLHWRHSYRRVSAFLDALTYMHAFSGGALHDAESARVPLLPEQLAWLEREWRPAAVASLAFCDPEEAVPPGSPLYVREGQAVQWFDRFFAVANSAERLHEIARSLGIDWIKR